MSRAEVGSTEEEGHRVKAEAEELTTSRRWEEMGELKRPGQRGAESLGRRETKAREPAKGWGRKACRPSCSPSSPCW